MPFSNSVNRKEESVRLLTEIRRSGYAKEKLRGILKQLVAFLHLQCQVLECSVQNRGKLCNDYAFLRHDEDKKNASELLSLADVGSILRTSSALVGAFCRAAARFVLSSEDICAPSLCYGEECRSPSSTSTTTPSVIGGRLSVPSHGSDTNSFMDTIFPATFTGDSFSMTNKERIRRAPYGSQIRTCEGGTQGNENEDGNMEFVRPHEKSSGCCCCCCSARVGSSKSSCHSVGELIHWLSASQTFSFLLHRRAYVNKHDVFILAFLLHRLAWLAMLLPISETQEDFKVSNCPNSLFSTSSSEQFSTVAPAAPSSSWNDVQNSSSVQENKKTISKDGRHDGENACAFRAKELRWKDSLQSSSTVPFSLSLPPESHLLAHPLFFDSCSSPCFSLLSALSYGLGELLQYDLLLYRRAKNELSTLLTSVAEASQWNVSEIVMSLMDMSFLFGDKENDLTTTASPSDYSSWLSVPPLSIFFFEAFAPHFSSSPYHNESELSPPTPSLKSSLCHESSLTASPAGTNLICRCPLHCPFTLTLVRYPARGRMCRHLQYFDAYNFVLAVMQSFSSSTTKGNSSSTATHLLSRDAVRHNDPLVNSASVENGDDSRTPTSNVIPTTTSPSPLVCAGGPCPICRNYIRIDELRIDFRVLRAMAEVQPLSTDSTPESLGNEKTDECETSVPSVFEPLSPSTHVLEWVVDSLHHVSTTVESEDDSIEKEDEQDKTSATNVNESAAKEGKLAYASLLSTHWSCVPPLHQSSFSYSMNDSHTQNDEGENELFCKCRCYVVKQTSFEISPNENNVARYDVSADGGAETPAFASSAVPSSPSTSSLPLQNRPVKAMSMGGPIEIVSKTKDTSSQSSPPPPLKRRRVDIAGHVLYVDE